MKTWWLLYKDKVKQDMSINTSVENLIDILINDKLSSDTDKMVTNNNLINNGNNVPKQRTILVNKAKDADQVHNVRFQ